MQLQANKILIVDDSANFRKILSTFLSKIFKDVQIDQHDPAASPDLNTAIDWGKYDLVLLDYNLGQEKTGLDWYQALKSIDNFPVTVMLTGEGSEQLAVKALKNGVDDYISKENLTKSRLTETIYEASQIHHEKLQKRLSFTQQGKAFNTELFYSALESSLKSQSNESRLYILKCKLVNQAEETDGIIFRDNLNRFVAKKVFYFLLSMEIKVKIISIQDKYIALFIENDSHDINYLPEIICKDMKKTTFTSGNVNCDFFIHVGVVPMNLNIIDASRVIDTGIVLTDSIDADKSTYSIYEESDEKIEPAAETKPDDSNFSVITAIKDNRLRPLYQPMVVVADIPNMSDCDTYDVRSRFISSSGVQLLEEEFAQLMEVDKNTRLIDNWLMRHTLGHLLEKRKGADDKLKFCVKLTHQSLSDPDFLQWLIKLLKEQTIPKNSFFLDIPIEDMLKSTKKYSGLMTYLQQTYGFKFILSGLASLDEYERLSKVCNFNFYRMSKIFTASLSKPKDVKEKWEELITKIHESNSYVIASYIEDATTLSNAIASGVDIVQGYFLGEPDSEFHQVDDIDIPA